MQDSLSWRFALILGTFHKYSTISNNRTPKLKILLDLEQHSAKDKTTTIKDRSPRHSSIIRVQIRIRIRFNIEKICNEKN